MEMTMNILPCGFLTTNEEGKITFINKYLTELLSMKEEDIIAGSNIYDLFPVGSKVYFETHIRPLLLMQGSVKEISVDLLRPDKTRVPVLLNGIVRRELIEGPATICYTISDISHRKKYERELLLAADKQKELSDQLQIQNDRLTNLAYIISHNVRSHVANISGLIDIFELADKKDKDWAWSMLINTVNSLDETIHHLNTILSLRDNPDLPMESINVMDEINKILQTIQMSTLHAKATIRCDIDSGERLTTNPAYFQSVLLNLLTNAVKYRSPDRDLDIFINMSREGDFTVLNVSDNGLGIDLSKYQDQLFGMYKTFHGNEDAKGLGLFLSKQHIEAMKGKMEVESTVGVGSTFKVFFPNL